MTGFQASVSRHANPLTGLPGRMLVLAEIERRAQSSIPFALLHVDINHLRHYNERFGFGRGDEVISLLAETMSTAAKTVDPAGSLVGHLGGVNFVALCSEAKVEQFAQTVISEFERKAPSLHAGVELPLLDVPAASRADPRVTLTVVALRSSRTPMPSYAAVTASVSRAKRAARSLHASSFLLDGNLMRFELAPQRIG
jgi:diguanylate cyclase (GGDEF)-like protein